jgi:hypothetical protein
MCQLKSPRQKTYSVFNEGRFKNEFGPIKVRAVELSKALQEISAVHEPKMLAQTADRGMERLKVQGE